MSIAKRMLVVVAISVGGVSTSGIETAQAQSELSPGCARFDTSELPLNIAGAAFTDTFLAGERLVVATNTSDPNVTIELSIGGQVSTGAMPGPVEVIVPFDGSQRVEYTTSPATAAMWTVSCTARPVVSSGCDFVNDPFNDRLAVGIGSTRSIYAGERVVVSATTSVTGVTMQLRVGPQTVAGPVPGTLELTVATSGTQVIEWRTSPATSVSWSVACNSDAVVPTTTTSTTTTTVPETTTSTTTTSTTTTEPPTTETPTTETPTTETSEPTDTTTEPTDTTTETTWTTATTTSSTTVVDVSTTAGPPAPPSEPGWPCDTPSPPASSMASTSEPDPDGVVETSEAVLDTTEPSATELPLEEPDSSEPIVSILGLRKSIRPAAPPCTPPTPSESAPTSPTQSASTPDPVGPAPVTSGQLPTPGGVSSGGGAQPSQPEGTLPATGGATATAVVAALALAAVGGGLMRLAARRAR